MKNDRLVRTWYEVYQEVSLTHLFYKSNFSSFATISTVVVESNVEVPFTTGGDSISTTRSSEHHRYETSQAQDVLINLSVVVVIPINLNQPVVRVNDDAIGGIPSSERQGPLEKQVSIVVQVSACDAAANLAANPSSKLALGNLTRMFFACNKSDVENAEEEKKASFYHFTGLCRVEMGTAF
ncbi:hypothetical protein BDZ45DRAFT_747508 [Acephala macrosclerotiorum]|nr:hypothetical protein BDZ45DRAFT_747508 [Acephala macrosclerotiorum]